MGAHRRFAARSDRRFEYLDLGEEAVCEARGSAEHANARAIRRRSNRMSSAPLRAFAGFAPATRTPTWSPSTGPPVGMGPACRAGLGARGRHGARHRAAQNHGRTCHGRARSDRRTRSGKDQRCSCNSSTARLRPGVHSMPMSWPQTALRTWSLPELASNRAGPDRRSAGLWTPRRRRRTACGGPRRRGPLCRGRAARSCSIGKATSIPMPPRAPTTPTNLASTSMCLARSAEPLCT